MEKETNAGYEIIEKLSVGNSIFVLGSMDSAYGTKYVTWQSNANNDPTNYFWGHYIQSYEDAREDLYKRAYEETLALNPNYKIRQEEKLPPVCMTVLPSNGALIKITHMEKGYSYSDISSDDPVENKELAKYINNVMGVSKEQEAAMVAGSMFGWNVPAANPRNYDDNGKPIKPKNKDYER